MRDYGSVSPRFWIGETGKKLRGDPEAQVLALYLMTSPHSAMSGVFHCPLLYMAHETGLTMEGAIKALARLSDVGFCVYEEASEMVLVVRMAAYQVGESLKAEDKRVVGLQREFERMPSGAIKEKFFSIYQHAFHLEQAPCKPLPCTSGSPSGSPFEAKTRQDKTRAGTKTDSPNPSGEGCDEEPEPEPRRKRRHRTTLQTFVDRCAATGEKPISEYEPLIRYVEATGLPMPFVQLGWREFKNEFMPGGVKASQLQADWRAHFLNYVKKGWLRLWWAKPDGTFELTTAGVQASRVHKEAA